MYKAINVQKITEQKKLLFKQVEILPTTSVWAPIDSKSAES